MPNSRCSVTICGCHLPGDGEHAEQRLDDDGGDDRERKRHAGFAGHTRALLQERHHGQDQGEDHQRAGEVAVEHLAPGPAHVQRLHALLAVPAAMPAAAPVGVRCP